MKNKLCPMCGNEFCEEHIKTLQSINARFLAHLIAETAMLVNSKSTELAVLEQIRRNCETIDKLDSSGNYMPTFTD